MVGSHASLTVYVFHCFLFHNHTCMFCLFSDECQTKYGNANAWRYCTKVFDMLTVAAVSSSWLVHIGDIQREQPLSVKGDVMKCDSLIGLCRMCKHRSSPSQRSNETEIFRGPTSASVNPMCPICHYSFLIHASGAVLLKFIFLPSSGALVLVNISIISKSTQRMKRTNVY